MASKLNITGFKGSPIPNNYYQQKAATDALCVIYGGWGYTTDMPVFYYTRRILSGLGFDVLTVDLDHSTDRKYARLSDEKRQEWFLTEIERIFDFASGQRRYRRTVLAAMGIGSMALAGLLISRKLGGHPSLVWLSPLLEAESIRETLSACSVPSLVVVGNRGAQYDQALLQRLSRNENLDLMIIERANDHLEVEGDALRSIELLAGYVSRLKRFLGAANDPSAGKTSSEARGRVSVEDSKGPRADREAISTGSEARKAGGRADSGEAKKPARKLPTEKPAKTVKAAKSSAAAKGTQEKRSVGGGSKKEK